jgi:hypothetical protein
MLFDLFFSAFHLEKKGLPNTIARLTMQPSAAIKEVIMGRRSNLYPPFKYLVLMGALIIIFSLRYRFFHNELTKSDGDDLFFIIRFFDFTEDQKNYIGSFFQFAEQNATLLNIAAIPIFAFFSWSLLSTSRYNFAENLILNTYITAQQLFCLLLVVPLLEFFPTSRHVAMSAYAVVVLLYNIWVYTNFFEGSRWTVFSKAILAVLASYIYQFPINFVIFYIYEHFVHHHMHWIPHIYDTI